YKDLNRSKSPNHPFFNAFIAVSFLQCMNVVTLIMIVNHLTNYKLKAHKETAVFLALALYITVTVINYFILWIKKEKILEKYDNCDRKRISKRNMFSWFYVILTFATFFYALNHFVQPQY